MGSGRMHRLLAAMLAAILLSACAGYQPKRFTAHDDCRDCPPGLLTGEDGVFTIGADRTRAPQVRPDSRPPPG